MFDKFGEFDSFSEINELAENLLNEGDIEWEPWQTRISCRARKTLQE